jgi:hypothetical protein
MDPGYQKHYVRRCHFLTSLAADFPFDIEGEDATNDEGEKAEHSIEDDHSSVAKEKNGLFSFLSSGSNVEKGTSRLQLISEDLGETVNRGFDESNIACKVP